MKHSRANVLAVAASARYEPCRNGGLDCTNCVSFFAVR